MRVFRTYGGIISQERYVTGAPLVERTLGNLHCHRTNNPSESGVAAGDRFELPPEHRIRCAGHPTSP